MFASRPLPAALLAALSLLLLPLAGAGPAAAAKAKPVKCKAGQATVKVGKRQACVTLGRAATTLDRLATAELKRTVAKAPKRHRHLLSAKAVARTRSVLARQPAATASAARGASFAPATAAAASGCAGQPERSRTGQPGNKDGYTVTASAAGWGGGTGSTMGERTTIEAVKGPITATKQEQRCFSWDGCPDADGVLHGTYEWSQVETFVGRQDGAELRTRSIMAVSAELTAHVGDDARVTSYEYLLDGRYEGGGDARLNGKVLKHIPTEITRIRASRAGLDPHKADDSGWQRAAYVARGPHGDRIPGSTLQGLAALVGLAEVAMQDDGRKALLNSEHHFNEDAACLPVTLTPDTLKVEPGQRVPVEVRITDLSGTELALPFRVTVSDGATDVTSGTSKATVTWTAPEDRKAYLLSTFSVRHVSKRGVAQGYHQAAWADKPPRFAAELSFSSKYTWESTHSQESNVGTDSECVTQTKGGGFQWLFLDSFPDDGGTVELVEGVPMFLLKPVTGTMTQDGTLTTTQAGPASYCQPPSSSAPRDGCKTLDVGSVVPSIGWEGDGAVKLELSGFRTPAFDGSCPLRTPDYGQPLSADLDLTSTAPVSLADLKDPNKKVVVIKGVLQAKGHEDCLSEGNGGCGDDPATSRIRYAIDGWTDLDWTLTLKRLEG